MGWNWSGITLVVDMEQRRTGVQFPGKSWELRERSRCSDHWDKWKPNTRPKVRVRNGKQARQGLILEAEPGEVP